MKIVISKNKEGNGYYTKIQNDYNGKHTEKYLSIQVPKGTDLGYGLYEVDGFLSTYEKKDGNIEFKLVVTDATLVKEFKEVEKTTNNQFKDFGDKLEFDTGHQIQIDESDLPF